MRKYRPQWLGFALIFLLFSSAAASQTLYLIKIKVYLNNDLVPAQYENGLDVSGVCSFGHIRVADAEDVPNGIVEVFSCDTDTLFISIDPSQYGDGVSLDCWGVDELCTQHNTQFTYDTSHNENMRFYLVGPPPPLRDPVSERWSPEAGRRSGQTPPWGTAYQTARRAVCNPLAEDFPALLYCGEAFEKQIDLAVAGRGMDFIFSRVHRSGAQGGAYFGGAWTHCFDIAVESPAENPMRSAKVRLGNGTTKTFSYLYNDTSTRYFYSPGWDAELRFHYAKVNTAFDLVFGDGVTWSFETFNFDGTEHLSKLSSITDRFGNSILLAYNIQGQLQTITDTLGRTYSLAYDSNQFLTSLTENDGLERTISYDYTDGKLAEVTYPEDGSLGYVYNSDGALLSITDGRDNVVITNAYGSDKRLTYQQFGEGPEAATVYYYYEGLLLQPGEKRGVRIIDGAGNATQHFFNANNQLVRLYQWGNGYGLTTRFQWDQHLFAGTKNVSDDLPTQITLPDGMVLNYTYAGPGLDNAAYRYRMNLAKIVRSGTNAYGTRKITQSFDHGTLLGGTPFWDARFGESFVTCHSIKSKKNNDNEILLSATAYAYSSDGLATLDGIDYKGIAPYAGNPFANCPPSQSFAAPNANPFFMQNLLAAGELYSSLLQPFVAASELYEPDPAGSPPGEGEAEPMTPMAPEDHHESFRYNAFGQPIEHLYPDNDEDGDPSTKVRRKDTFDYDANGYLNEQIIDADGLAFLTTLTNDAVGRVTQRTDPKGYVTDIEYDDRDLVTQIESPAIASAANERPVTKQFYDQNSNLVRTCRYWFDNEGAPIPVQGETEADDYLAEEYVYDSRNRLTDSRRENGTGLTSTQFRYDANGNLLQQLSPLAVNAAEPANNIAYVYDMRGLPIQITQGNSSVTDIQYDAAGRITCIVEGYGTPEARATHFEYDPLGYLAKQIDDAGLITQFDRDALGRPTQIENRQGNSVLARTDYVYSILGRLTNINVMYKDANGQNVGDGLISATFEYTDAGSLIAKTFEGDTTSYAYDSAMRLSLANSPGGNTLEYLYDENGNVVEQIEYAYNTVNANRRSFATWFEYDELDRLISIGIDRGNKQKANANTTEYAYDSLNQLVLETDPRGNIIRHTYDPLGRRISTAYDPNNINAFLAFDYDDNDRLIRKTDPNGNETHYSYDVSNRLTQTQFADGKTECVDYDAVDNIIRHTAPDGLQTELTYDPASRPTLKTFHHLAGRATPGNTAYQYDALGRITRAANAASTVTHAYDSLSNPVSENILYDTIALEPLSRTFDQKGQLVTINPHGAANTLTYSHDADGKVRTISRQGALVAQLDYLGARPTERKLYQGSQRIGGSNKLYEGSGQRPCSIAQVKGAYNTADSRTYSWDPAYNLDAFQITGGSLADDPVDYNYDALNRIDTDSPGFNPDWTFDDAGNRTGTGYDLTGQDAQMHRYTEVDGLRCNYDSQGALVAVGTSANTRYEYQYDANDRLIRYQEVTIGARTQFQPLNLSDGHWTPLSGSWAVNDNGTPANEDDDYLQETSSNIGAILYQPDPLPSYGATFKYRSLHDPDNPDADLNPGEFSSDDYPPKYYAQILFAVDTSNPPNYPYAALRIEPDRLSVVVYDGAAIHELNSIAAITQPNTWYTVSLRMIAGGKDFVSVMIERHSEETPGDPDVLLVLPSELPDINQTALGFTVGEKAQYDFQLGGYTEDLLDIDMAETYIEWAYDAYGRKISESVYTKEAKLDALTLYVWDGWRLLAEVDGLTHKVIAEYVPGPDYTDDIVASRRDLDANGTFNNNEHFYHLTDQQFSTIALLDGSGEIIERYGYDPFGTPSFYDPDGAPRTESICKNNQLYTGRQWLPGLNLYDFRQRLYNPNTGRFLSTDPKNDPNNLGNPYTYVANNPNSFLDPYGLERWGEQSYFADVLDVGYGYFVGGPVAIVSGIGYMVAHPIQTDIAMITLGVSMYFKPLDTTKKLASSFYDQFEDSDTAGQAAFSAATTIVPSFSGLTKAASAAKAGRAAQIARIGGELDRISAKLVESTSQVINRAQNASISSIGRGYGGHVIVDRVANEAQGAISQANRILLSGGTGSTRWGTVYQQSTSHGWFTNIARRNALHSIATKQLMQNRYVREARSQGYLIEFDRGSLTGSKSAKDVLLRPDVQIRTLNGKIGVIDWTTPNATSKIFRYGNPSEAPWLINVTLP